MQLIEIEVNTGKKMPPVPSKEVRTQDQSHKSTFGFEII